MAELKRAREMAAILNSSPASAAPSGQLRQRILASVGVERRRFGWWAPFWAVAATMAIFAAYYFRGRERDFAALLASAREQQRVQAIELTRLNEAFAILTGPDTTETVFGQGQQQPPKGKVFLNPTQGVLLVVSNLPPAQRGKTYEMWIIPKGRMAVPAGLFQSAIDGTAMHIRRGPVDLNSTVAVTVENEGGAAQPTTPPIIVAAITSRG